MGEMIHQKANEVEAKHKDEHEGYEYYKRELVPKGFAQQCAVSLYEIPPLKSAYPYHYHVKNEESFYILSGHGILKTPLGERTVSAGDFLFFPADEKGAHKLTNASETHNDLDVAFYPDSGKIGVWGKNINQLYQTKAQVEYYLDE